MSNQTKTIKIKSFKIDRIQNENVDPTKVINPDSIITDSFEDEIKTLSLQDLKYRLEFEVTDPTQRALIKAEIKKRK
ncbi:MAG: hypothetical protein LBM72_02805 [Mycoplasmataceae bacterium]|jgi:hypothetical protein|nr:hypothetical protein [Mycoplasmataceae bacterium]